MNTRIYKTEKYIPKVGLPVFQVLEEVEVNGQVLHLDPRIPSEEELVNADESFVAAQQKAISDLSSELAECKTKMEELAIELGKAQETVALQAAKLECAKLEGNLVPTKS